MDVTGSIDLSCSPETLFSAVDDLSDYPAWLEIVTRAIPTPSDADDGLLAWQIELRGRLGPLSRYKQLRMVRIRHTRPRLVVFERRELDGRRHAVWRLEAEVVEIPDGARLEMRLHYGGAFGGQLLERILDEEIERSRPRLAARVLASS